MKPTYEKYNVTIKGIRPLMHHRMAIEPASKKRKTEYIPEEEAKGALYLNDDGVPYQPAIHIEGSMITASKMFKWKGRKTLMDVFKSSVFVSPIEIPFEIPNDSLDYVIDKRHAKIKMARILRCRPRWDDWQFSFVITTLQPDQLSMDQLEDVLTHAGLFVGIGDFRPKFGTFEITKFEQMS